MCSIGDDNLDINVEKYMPNKQKLNLLENAKCNKCKENSPIVVLRHKDPYCKSCFTSATTHKFKSILGKHRLIRPNDRVLIYYQIGHPSTALLHFLRVGLDLETPKKLRFIPVVLFIDDQLHLNVDERKNVLENVKKQAAALGFKLYLVPFVDYVLDNKSLPNLIKEQNLEIKNNSNLLQEKLNTANKTAKNDIITIYRRQLLVEVATLLECKFVFTPELSRNVASQILTNISLGRGPQIALDTGFCDDRDEMVKILRPLKQFDVKELAFYNYLNDLEPISIRQPFESSSNSIQSLIKTFVDNLQLEYPATVSTIVKTGDKLGAINNETKKKCLFCKTRLNDDCRTDLSSSESTRFSHWISTQSCEKYEDIVETFENTSSENYCFACAKLQPCLQENT